MRASRIIVFMVLLAGVPLGRASEGQDLRFLQFERYLDSLRQQAEIPGLSAAIVSNRRIAWEKGFGFQDVETSIAATPHTPYLVGDLTQTLTSVLAMQCVEQGTLDLDEPVQNWGAETAEPGATVRAVLAHASPSASNGFKYDPSRYASLARVIDGCGGGPYRKLLAEEILDRLGMVDSVPGRELGDPSAAARELFDPATLDRYSAVLKRLAVPYKIDRSGKAARSEYPQPDISASTGLVSTVRDLSRYDAGVDDLVLLLPDSLRLSWTNAVSSRGVTLPTGLGWFVQTYNGERLVWHFGLSPGSFSSLILKVPSRDVTLILLANSDGLSAAFSLAEGDVTSSVFARLFLRFFV